MDLSLQLNKILFKATQRECQSWQNKKFYKATFQAISLRIIAVAFTALQLLAFTFVALANVGLATAGLFYDKERYLSKSFYNLASSLGGITQTFSGILILELTFKKDSLYHLLVVIPHVRRALLDEQKLTIESVKDFDGYEDLKSKFEASGLNEAILDAHLNANLNNIDSNWRAMCVKEGCLSSVERSQALMNILITKFQKLVPEKNESPKNVDRKRTDSISATKEKRKLEEQNQPITISDDSDESIANSEPNLLPTHSDDIVNDTILAKLWQEEEDNRRAKPKENDPTDDADLAMAMGLQEEENKRRPPQTLTRVSSEDSQLKDVLAASFDLGLEEAQKKKKVELSLTQRNFNILFKDSLIKAYDKMVDPASCWNVQGDPITYEDFETLSNYSSWLGMAVFEILLSATEKEGEIVLNIGDGLPLNSLEKMNEQNVSAVLEKAYKHFKFIKDSPSALQLLSNKLSQKNEQPKTEEILIGKLTNASEEIEVLRKEQLKDLQKRQKQVREKNKNLPPEEHDLELKAIIQKKRNKLIPELIAIIQGEKDLIDTGNVVKKTVNLVSLIFKEIGEISNNKELLSFFTDLAQEALKDIEKKN